MKIKSFFVLLLLCVGVLHGEDTVVSVFHFENVSGREELGWMSRALADGLTSRLDGGSLVFVEREDLEAVLKEQKLGLSGLTDENTARELGKLLNAEHLIQGSFVSVDERLRISAKISDSESGEILHSVSREASEEEYFDLEASLAWDLAEFYGFSPEEEGVSLSQEALKLYYKGLLSLDAKDYEAAKGAFQSAIKEDPAFQGPRDSLEDSYRFLKDFRKARYQRELNVLYKRLQNLLNQAEEDPFLSWGDRVTALAMKGKDISALTARLEKEPELSWGTTRADTYWHAQTVMMEIADYAEEHFEDTEEALRMYEGIIAISLMAKTEMGDDPFLPELIYQELLSWFYLDHKENIIAICESLMFGWPDYRMMWAVEDFYEDALEE